MAAGAFSQGCGEALHRDVAFPIAGCNSTGAGPGAAADIEAVLVSDRLPNAIDRHVASRIRARRREMGLSQETVCAATGVTFQQFQKYERAINRISAGALYQLAIALEVP